MQMKINCKKLASLTFFEMFQLLIAIIFAIIILPICFVIMALQKICPFIENGLDFVDYLLTTGNQIQIYL
jgi:hypothetical protein